MSYYDKSNDQLKNKIKNIAPAELEAHGVIAPAKTSANGEKTYICPDCNNGAKGKTGDGLAVKKYGFGYNYKCFSCGKSLDNISLLAKHYRIENKGAGYIEIIKRAAADFGLSYESITAPLKPSNAALISLIKKDIKFSQSNLKGFITRNGGLWRGLTFETLEFFNCGYDPYWIKPNARLKNVKNATPTPRVIIPSGNHYLARLTVPIEKYEKAHDSNYIVEKDHAGKKATFGIETITEKTEIVLVTEGEIDCMSNWQAEKKEKEEFDFLRISCDLFETKDIRRIKNDGTQEPVAWACLVEKAFIATSGAAETFWIEEVTNKCKELNCRPSFVIVFDDDDAGHKNAPKCKDELLRRGYPAAVKFLKRG